MKASDFDLLNDVKEVAELCSKHGSPLFQFRDLKPFCKECKREDKQAQDEQIAKDGTNAYLKINPLPNCPSHFLTFLMEQCKRGKRSGMPRKSFFR